jgi:hypothetical protein
LLGAKLAGVAAQLSLQEVQGLFAADV